MAGSRPCSLGAVFVADSTWGTFQLVEDAGDCFPSDE